MSKDVRSKSIYKVFVIGFIRKVWICSMLWVIMKNMAKVVFLLYSPTSLLRVSVSANFLPARPGFCYISHTCFRVCHHPAHLSSRLVLLEMPASTTKPEDLRFKENEFGCFGTQRYKYQYGMLLHDVPKARENTMGPFLLPAEDDFQATLNAQVFGETVELTRETCRKSFRVETHHIKTILAATRKLTLGRSDSGYKSNFTLMRKLYLTQ